MFAVVVDCHDVDVMCAFWSATLGQEVSGRWVADDGGCVVELGDRVPAFGRPALVFRQVPGPRTGAGRLHLDIVVGARCSREDEVARLVGLGATVVTEGPGSCTVLADPEGNEFRVLGAGAGDGAGDEVPGRGRRGQPELLSTRR